MHAPTILQYVFRRGDLMSSEISVISSKKVIFPMQQKNGILKWIPFLYYLLEFFLINFIIELIININAIIITTIIKEIKIYIIIIFNIEFLLSILLFSSSKQLYKNTPNMSVSGSSFEVNL